MEKKIIDQCMREGLPLPERIQNAPELIPGLELYYVGFSDLMDSRSIGMSLGPIQWKTIHDYCVALGLNEDQSEEMHFHIKTLDSVYLRHTRKK